ncbi:hypothetical protein ADUPG1_005053, partial [Aduncisulcus paluster]
VGDDDDGISATCTNHGDCDTTLHECECSASYYGSNCSFTCPVTVSEGLEFGCGAGTCDAGTCQCNNNAYLGATSGLCAEFDACAGCSDNGTCVFPDGCVCVPGFTGDTCSDVDPSINIDAGLHAAICAALDETNESDCTLYESDLASLTSLTIDSS